MFLLFTYYDFQCVKLCWFILVRRFGNCHYTTGLNSSTLVFKVYPGLQQFYPHYFLPPRHNNSQNRFFISRIRESFQLQMGFPFPFLRANDLRSSLLNIRACIFLLSCTQGVHTQGQCTIGTKIFSRVCSTDSFSCSEQKNWKKTRLKQGSI